MAPLPVPADWRGLGARIASAVILAPPVVAALYVGTPYSDILITAVATIAAWEWARLCRAGKSDSTTTALIVTVVAAAVMASFGAYDLGAWIIALGGMATLFLGSREDPARAPWLAAGAVYLGTACMALLWLRADPLHGRAIVFWLLFVVWATDIGAYAAGRLIGGPRLAPSFSPKKTWAGLIGGAVAAAAVGLVTAAVLDGEPLSWAGLSAALALVGQVGDLFESALKRHFGAKDSGALIPGHGGVLDRIDGLLAVSLVVAGLTWGRGIFD
ncbi:MAG: phosphatidate cytidylyltransferase [Alphaproteobacteria bacterium]|nr:MAG: phosphatidate cytidylyltransferase [Alphaproteobacteria bacterium]